MSKLTNAERETINAAVRIIHSKMNGDASWQIYVSRYKDHGDKFSACYFDSAGGQHSSMYGGTPADVIEKGIAHEARAERDDARLREIRVERLRKELAELTGEIAA